MRSRLLWRRSATAVGTYASVALGVLGSVIAAHLLGLAGFGLFTVVVSATSFFQTLLDLTVEEAVIKFGFRYQEAGEWGKLRRLFRRALQLKAAGGVLAGLALVGLAPLSQTLWGSNRLVLPLLLVAPLPLLQSPETLAGAVLYLRGRYDVRSYFLAVSMAIRLAALAIGAHFGVTQAVAALVVAQLLATAAVGAAGLSAFRRYPSGAAVALGTDRWEIFHFVLQSSGATGILALRTALAPLILALWRRGFRTISSCEHEPGTPCAWIGFPTLEEAERFQRMTGVMIVVPEEQDFAGASEASFDAGYSVRGSAVAFFPVADTPAVLAA